MKKQKLYLRKLLENADLGYTMLSYFKLANINFNKKDFQSMESIMTKL